MPAILDSITKQQIKEGDRAVLILLVNASSEENNTALLARSSERLKLASLPIHGTWGEASFVPDEPQGIAVRSALDAFATWKEDFSKLLESIWSDSSIVVESPAWNCSNHLEYSIFVTKEVSLEKVSKTTIVQRTLGGNDVEKDIELMGVLIEKYHQSYLDLNNISGRGDDYYDVAAEMDEFEEILSFRYSGALNDKNAASVPYAAKALSRYGIGIFSSDLRETLQSEDYSGIPEGAKELPKHYAGLHRSIHECVSIVHSLNLLDIQLTPAFTSNAAFRDTSRMELMAQVLAEDISNHVKECKDYSDEPAAEIDRLVNPLKSCVADALRTRNRLPDLDR